MGSNIAFGLDELVRGKGAEGSGEEGVGTSQAFAADTSAGPVTVTLPALDGLEDGYLVRVYDSGSNASVNNITINDADAAELDVIAEDDGERWLVVVGGAWEVRGYLPGPSGGGGQQIYPIAIPTEFGGGMYTLDSEGDYNPGDLLILTAPGGYNGVFVFAVSGENIDGEGQIRLNGAMTIYLEATGSGYWHVAATSPDQRHQELAAGGDEITLPALADVPYGAVWEVVYNDTGNSDPVTIVSAEGYTISGEPISLSSIYDAAVFINTGYGSWQQYNKA